MNFVPRGALLGRAHRLTWMVFASVHAAHGVPNAERTGRPRPGLRGAAAPAHSHKRHTHENTYRHNGRRSLPAASAVREVRRAASQGKPAER